MNLASVDLNLLEPLIALLEERSVTRSAIRTQRSQPAMSAALARLRRIFDDELLRRVGNHYELTPVAEQLLPACLDALASVHRVFGRSAAFDPSESRRTYRIAISDYASALIGPHIAEMINAAAPRAGVEFAPILRTLLDLAPESLRPYDGLILPHGYLTEQPHLDLFSDRWVLLAGPHGKDWGDRVRRCPAARPLGVTLHGVAPAGDLEDVARRFEAAYGVEADGAVLIRPDGFIASRHATSVNGAKALDDALDRLWIRTPGDSGRQLEYPRSRP